MPPQLALFGCILFAGYCLYRDHKRRALTVSSALWLVVVWISIVASRPVSAWLALGEAADISENELEGNSIDRNVFLLLIVWALLVLRKRNVSWRAVVQNNLPLFGLYAFFACSLAWSDYPFVAFKRWIKDLGNVVMVLVILSDKDPIEALRAVLSRCAYLLIPFSVLLIKYYPQYGKAFTRWEGKTWYLGVTLGKNLLGATVLVFVVFLIWALLHPSRSDGEVVPKKTWVIPLVVLAMGIWLLRLSNSATSLACAMLGAAILAMMAVPLFRRRLDFLFGFLLVTVFTLLVASSVLDLKGSAAEMLGRDSTLTGRNEIWKAVLSENTNPLIGTGFYSFWLGTRSERLSEKNHYHFRLNQAHNGYLELYLNGGGIGLCLLLWVLCSGGMQIKRDLLVQPDFGSLKLAYWIAAIVHNWSEASFCRESPLWFILILVIVKCPGLSAESRDSHSIEKEELSQPDQETVQSWGTRIQPAESS